MKTAAGQTSRSGSESTTVTPSTHGALFQSAQSGSQQRPERGCQELKEQRRRSVSEHSRWLDSRLGSWPVGKERSVVRGDREGFGEPHNSG
jgi:hypothetical protein